MGMVILHYLMMRITTMNNNDSIRFKISGGLSDLQDVYKTLEAYADFKKFDIVHCRIKQRGQTPIHDLNLGMVHRNRKS